MAFNLRLPQALETDARARCERIGISLNALVCVALDAYLRGPEPAQGPAIAPQAVAATPQPPVPPPKPEAVAKLSELRERVAKPLLTAKPVPPPHLVLGPKATKADRQRLAKWYRENPQT
ncbi:hypothetical protein O4H66_16130 [Comamonadaceae bacterium G21597-S1]|nr:hypothetical protein [Comamonadaceae bacterium G21597-S1]